MDIAVRTISEDEVEAWSDARFLAFSRPPVPGEAAARRPDMDLARTLGAFDGTRVVGTFRSMARRLTVPGCAEIAVDAITNVGVIAPYRRGGLLGRMMAADLDAAAARGEPMAALIASEYQIYGRFGFGPAVFSDHLTIDARRARLRPSVAERLPRLTGTFVDAATARAEFPALYDAHRAGQPGALDRDGSWWDHRLGLLIRPSHQVEPSLRLLARTESGEAVGYVIYRVEEHWERMDSVATLTVVELIGADPAVTAWLWRYCLDVDLVTTVQAGDRSTADALPWLLADARAISGARAFDLLWLRPLDVPAVLSARGYAAPGRLVIDVTDPLGHAAGRYSLVAEEDGTAGCERLSAAGPADLRMSVAALGSCYLGGVPPESLAAAGLVGEQTPGALARAGAMFRSSPPPWCCTWF